MTADETSSSKIFFEVLKDFKNSNFTELFSYHNLGFDDELDEISVEKGSSEEMDEYDEINKQDVKDQYTSEAMETIAYWMHEHPNETIASVRNRLRKVTAMSYIKRFSQCIWQDRARVE